MFPDPPPSPRAGSSVIIHNKHPIYEISGGYAADDLSEMSELFAFDLDQKDIQPMYGYLVGCGHGAFRIGRPAPFRLVAFCKNPGPIHFEIMGVAYYVVDIDGDYADRELRFKQCFKKKFVLHPWIEG